MANPRDLAAASMKGDASDARRAALLDAATRVFLRYGFKKTSMDDVARAAGVSRQGLYLHFATKELLFKDALLRFVTAMQTAMEEALAKDDRDVEERVLSAFEAVHGQALGEGIAENGDELLEAAGALVGPITEDLDRAVVAGVARTLKSSGIAAEWKPAGIAAKDLAEHLLAASYGWKHRVSNIGEYVAKMRVAVQLVCRRSRDKA